MHFEFTTARRRLVLTLSPAILALLTSLLLR